MRDKLQKAIDISRRTGDRVIVFDSVKSENPYVIMGLDEYEKIVIGRSEVRDLTEEELLDKINRDIAIWKSDNEDTELERKTRNQFKKKDEKLNNFEFENTDEEDENTYYYDEPEISPLEILKKRDSLEEIEQEKRKNIWKIPGNIKKSAEEIM